MTSRTPFRTAPSEPATAGRKECASTATTISAAAKRVSLLGRPAMLSTVSLNAAVAISVLPAALGLDRALRICVRGAAKTRRTPRAIEPMTTSVSRVEPSQRRQTPSRQLGRGNRTGLSGSRREAARGRSFVCGRGVWTVWLTSKLGSSSLLTARATRVDRYRTPQTVAPPVGSSSPKGDDDLQNRLPRSECLSDLEPGGDAGRPPAGLTPEAADADQARSPAGCGPDS